MQLLRETIEKLAAAAQDTQPVAGLTHCFYRYPARFSPQFAAAAIECFSEPGDLVMDPYMGGGTTVIESLIRGRRVIGNDLNSLATFVARVKTTALAPIEIRTIRQWANKVVPTLSYRIPREQVAHTFDEPKMRNLNLARARFISKIVAGALATIDRFPTVATREFVRCALLQTTQWALDGRKRQTSAQEFRTRLVEDVHAMLAGLTEFMRAMPRKQTHWPESVLTNLDASAIPDVSVFRSRGQRVRLVVTSPPYPGVHMLYHRWQVDGRRETPAPYWITGTNDGQASSFYNFGDRRDPLCSDYFAVSLNTLKAIRSVMEADGIIVQMLAFNRPDLQLPIYLRNVKVAGFREVKSDQSRIWRNVPNRKWHASGKGRISASREVVLIHRAD